MSRRAVVLACAATLLLYLAVALSFSLRTPAWENNDEQDHARYAEFIVGHGALPPISIANGIESHQPPLYYLTLAAWQKALAIHAFTPSLSPPSGPPSPTLGRVNEGSHDYTSEQLKNAESLHGLRLLSIVFGAITVGASFLITLLLTAELPLAVAVGATVGVWPKFDVVAAAVSNEAMTDALVASALLFLAMWLRKARSLAWSLAVGVALGAAVLTKFTALPIAGLMLGVIIILGARRRDWLSPAAALVAFAAVSGWWFVHNALAYGDPLADAASRAYLAKAVPGLIWPMPGWSATVLSFGAKTLVKTVWYDGGWNQLQLPHAVNVAVAVFALACVARFVWSLTWRPPRVTRWRLIAVIVLPAAGSVIAWLLILRETTQAEGRYLLVAAPAWAFVLCVGADVFSRGRAWIRWLGLSLWPAVFLAMSVFVFARYEIPFGGT